LIATGLAFQSVHWKEIAKIIMVVTSTLHTILLNNSKHVSPIYRELKLINDTIMLYLANYVSGTCRPASIMLKNLPIMLSGISQKSSLLCPSISPLYLKLC